VPTPVFVSYSHRNNAEKEALCEYLTTLPDVALWTDADILPGDEWEQKIDAAMSNTRVAVLLITKDFLNSSYVKNRELPRILERQRGEGVRVVPIIARACPWKIHRWIGGLQVLPKNGEPIWRDDSRAVDEVLNEIAETINALLLLESAPTPPRSQPVAPQADGDTASRVRAIAGGLDALSDLRSAPAVNDTITTFREDFHTASVNIELVRHYKRLHDELHTIHIYYRQLVDNVRWFPEEGSVGRLFETVHADLATSVDELKRIQRETPPGALSSNWIRSVEDATSRLAAGVETRMAAAVTAAIASLRRVLSQEPGRLDSRMNGAARDINVNQLVRALRRVHDSASSSGPGSRLVDRFADGLAGLETLENEWKTMIGLHKGWEEVEATLRLIDESIGEAPEDTNVEDLQELRVQFEFLTAAIAALVTSDSGDWLDRLRRVHDGLSSALSKQDDAGARKHYVQFRSLAGRRFKNLDTKLKDLCGELSQLGKRLELLAD
jgi:hypothetical protein